MEDFIYILLVLVISVVGAIRQNQKRKRVKQVPFEGKESHPYEKEPVTDSAPPQSNNKPHDIWDEFFGVDDDFVEQPVVLQEEPVVILEEEPKSEYEEEINIIPDQISDEISKSFVEEEIEREEKSILEDFDLKKAVVYAEILNPKYL